jgi:two-component system response regulator YesN
MRVLIADDDPMVRQLLTFVIGDTDSGHEVVGSAPDPETALSLTVEHRPDVIITDLVMGSSTGPAAGRGGYLATLRQHAPDARIIIFSGQSPAPDPLPEGADLYLVKPADPETLLSAVAGRRDRL